MKNMKMNKMAFFRFLYITLTISFSLDTDLVTYIPCKEPLEGCFEVKDALRVVFRCAFY